MYREQIKRDEYGVPLPLDLQPIKDMQINGFVPAIINIAPVTNIPLLLGEAEPDDPGQQLSSLN